VTHYLDRGGEARYLAPLLKRWDGTRANKITPADVSKLASHLYGHTTPATMRRHFYVPLNAVLRSANLARLCPLIRFEPPKVERRPVSYATDKWLEDFFPHAHFRISAIVLFMTLTAARVSEAVNLTADDVDLRRAEAILRRTKNGKARRVPLAPVLVEALERCLARNESTVFGYAARWSVNQAIRRVCEKAKIKYLSSHQVGRHAFAARLLAQGKSLKLVQEGGGWATIQVVAQSYAHLEQKAIDDALRAAAQSVPALPAPK
jgi:integrase